MSSMAPPSPCAARRVGRVAAHLAASAPVATAAAPVAAAAARPSPEEVEVVGMSVRDIRFHTSKDSSGSDARSPDPDYSCAYIELTTSVGITASGLAFTIGRGNETVVKACEVLSRYIHGLTLADVIGDFNKIWRQLTNDDQLVWIGPEKGPVHQAAAGILNALWCGRRHFVPPPPFKFPL
jgi:L-fuconate dehydratase